MKQVLTLVNTNGLPASLEAEASAFVKARAAQIHEEKRLGDAIEISFSGTLPDIDGQAGEWQVDYAVQDAERRGKKLLVSDMESTLVENEFLDDIATLAGVGDQVREITTRAMRGEINFDTSLRARLHLLKGFSVDLLEQAWSGLRWMPGAKELVRTLNEHNIPTLIVSGGFRFFTGRVREILGAKEDHANDFEILNGRLTGEPKGRILGADSKREILLASGVAPPETIAIGDGANDIPMLQTAGFGIAYHAKPAVAAAAPHRVRYSDLRAALYFLGYSASSDSPALTPPAISSKSSAHGQDVLEKNTLSS